MIPIPVFWTKYTATMRGSAVKFVPCENCSTEYVYLLEREGVGVGTSVYLTNEEGAADHSKAAAQDTLKSYLENDYDAIPCPVCGHYQRHMYPKLLESKWNWMQSVIFIAMVIGCLVAVIAVYRSINYWQHPGGYSLPNVVGAWVILLTAILVGVGMWIIRSSRVRHFNPNVGNPHERIAFGRSRAVTREEFDRGNPLGKPESPPG